MKITVQLKLGILLACCAAAHSGAAETYYYSGTTRGHYANVSYWKSASGESPAYPPTSASCSADDLYVVRDGKTTWDDAAGTANMQIYGKVVYGEIGGTAGNHTEESQYPRTNGARINFRHADGATFAKGTYLARNGNQSDRHNRVLGKITVTAPKDAPFSFVVSNPSSDNSGAGVDFENAFVGASTVGMDFNGTRCGNWNFKGDCSQYLGSMTFRVAGSTVSFAAACGSLTLDDLSLGAGVTATVQIVSSPVTVNTLTLGDRACVKYAGSLSGATGAIVANTATIEAQSVAQTGTATFVLPTLASAFGGTVRIPLLKSATGGLNEQNFNVVVAEADLSAYQGTAIDADGDAQTFVAVFQWDQRFFLTSDGSTLAGGYKSAAYWQDGGGVSAPYAPSDSNCNVPLVVRNARTLNFDNNFVAQPMSPIYGEYVQIGEVGGTTGTLQFRLQYEVAYVEFKSPLYLANGTWYIQCGNDKTTKSVGRAIVTAPADNPFLITERRETPTHKFDMSFESAEGCALKGASSTAGAKFLFLRSLAAYRGTMDFSLGPRKLTFDAAVGATDMEALLFATAATVTVQNVAAPLKAKAMTVGADSLFTLTAATYGARGTAVSNACLCAETAAVTGPVAFKLTGAVPRLAGGAKLKLLTATKGTLPTVENFTVLDQTAGKAKMTGYAVVSDGDGESLVATFEPKRGFALTLR